MLGGMPQTGRPGQGPGARERTASSLSPMRLSALRLACLPAFIVLLAQPHRQGRLAAAFLLAAAALTDGLDGYIARHFDQVSTLGKMADPLVDRALVLCALVGATAIGALPIWLVVVIALREGVVLAGSALLFFGSRTARIDVSRAGKAGALGMMVALPLFIMAHAPFRGHEVALAIAWVAVVGGQVLAWLAVAPVRAQGPLRLGRGRGPEAAPAAIGPDAVKAVIMAGGEGTRLRPLTYNQPKPMIPMANRPLMEHVIDLLRRHGFTDIVVTVAYQANAIENYFGNGAEFGASIVYASEEPPLGTAGSVRNAMRELDEPFLVISGDVLTDIDLGAVVDFHYRKKALATIALRSMPNPLEFGIVMTRPDGSVERFLEKPSWGQVFSDTINTGIYVLEPGIFDFIADGVVDFSADVFPRLLGRDRPLLYGYVTRGLLGGHRHAGGLRPGASRHPRRPRRRRTAGVFAWARASGWETAPRSTPPPCSGPGHHRGLLPGRGRGHLGRVHGARPQCPGRGRRLHRARRGARQRLSGPRRPADEAARSGVAASCAGAPG